MIRIPIFPLAIFPLPGEMVPLHIFEPRYRQLLDDAEKRDISFGIFFNHVNNTHKLGSLVKLESVIKRFSGGESDIIVKCIDLFEMETLHRTYKDKLYPGGDVELHNIDLNQPVGDKLQQEFNLYLKLLLITHAEGVTSIFNIANELSLDNEDKLKFVESEPEKRKLFLLSRLRYQTHLVLQAEKSKDVFHLN
ncbi:MAG TPA: LON peptidase substrate-binding domain-containing protein [Cyclobacteriaceae bacterium]|nr:LON peptidase substrate-binding domain-containing protein [Cyclobacteriaceae bacterium]